MYLFETLKPKDQHHWTLNFLYGALTGAISSLIAAPFWAGQLNNVKSRLNSNQTLEGPKLIEGSVKASVFEGF